MHTKPAIKRPASPPAAIAIKPVGPNTEAVGGPPAAVTSRSARRPVRFVLAKAMSALRGDKYMVGAYPADRPATWSPANVSPRADATATDPAALSATPSKGR
jgi:hypothetical protein